MAVTPMRRVLPFLAGPLLLAALASAQNKPNLAAPRLGAPKPFQVVEATIPEMRSAMEQGRITSRELVTQYLARIGMYEDKLHA